MTAARSLFPRVAKHVGITLPISNKDWACLEIEQAGKTSDGLRYFKHGYGVQMDDGTCRVDIDLGAAGEIDGFDAWRLFNFAQDNGIDTPFTDHKAVQICIELAVEANELEYSGYILYYQRK